MTTRRLDVARAALAHRPTRRHVAFALRTAIAADLTAFVNLLLPRCASNIARAGTARWAAERGHADVLAALSEKVIATAFERARKKRDWPAARSLIPYVSPRHWLSFPDNVSPVDMSHVRRLWMEGQARVLPPAPPSRHRPSRL